MENNVSPPQFSETQKTNKYLNRLSGKTISDSRFSPKITIMAVHGYGAHGNGQDFLDWVAYITTGITSYRIGFPVAISLIENGSAEDALGNTYKIIE